MSVSQLEQLREELKKKAGGANSTFKPSGGDNALFRFWNAKMGETSTIRFLSDGTGEDNLFFWVERRVINLPFDGIVGRPDYAGKKVEVSVPCMKMFGREHRCPILEETNKYWKTELEDVARRYWPKRTFLTQGFVRQAPEWIPGREDQVPENPIRRFNINQSLFKNVEQQLQDPDMMNMPNDYDNGSDFRIIKTQQGEHANYSTSSFARRESSLTDQEREAIEKYGLFNLREFLPKQPDDEGVRVIEEMFRESLEGLPYDPNKWASFYRPYGMDFDKANTQTSASVPSNYQQQSSPAQSSAPEPAPAPEAKAPEPENKQPVTSSPDDALARLRAEVAKSQG